jgi:hypothetical protein
LLASATAFEGCVKLIFRQFINLPEIGAPERSLSIDFAF